MLCDHELKLDELSCAPDHLMYLETKHYKLALDGASGWRRLPPTQSKIRVSAH